MNDRDRIFPVVIDPTTSPTGPFEVSLGAVYNDPNTLASNEGAPSGNVAGSLIPTGAYINGFNATWNFYTKNFYQAATRFDSAPFNRKLIDSVRLYTNNENCGHDFATIYGDNPYNYGYGVAAFAQPSQWGSATSTYSAYNAASQILAFRYPTGAYSAGWSVPTDYAPYQTAFVSTVQSWADQSTSNFGLVLRTVAPGGEFGSTWCNVYTSNLYLEVTYHDRPNSAPTVVANSLSPANNASLQGATASLSGAVSDPDGDLVSADLEIRNAQNTLVHQTSISNLASGSTFSFPIPSGLRGVHTWKITPRDSQVVGTPGETRTITLTDTAPTISATAPASSALNGPVTFTATASDPDGDAIAVRFKFTKVSDSSVTNRDAGQGSQSYLSQPGDFSDGTAYSWVAEATANGATVVSASRQFTYSDALPVVTGSTRKNSNLGPTETDGDAAGSDPGRSVSIPFFAATGTDADGDAVTFDYQVCPPQAGGAAPAGYNSASCDATSIGAQGPSTSALTGTLVWGAKYWWRVAPRANGRAGSPTAWRSFMVSVSDCNPAVTTYCDLSQYSYGYSPYLGFSTNEADGSGVSNGIGGFTKTETDMTLPGVPGFALQRTYNSGDQREGVFGKGWSSIADVGLQEYPSKNVLIVMPDGRRSLHPYVKGATPAQDSYTNQKGFFDTLEKPSLAVDKVWKLTQKDKTALWFDGTGRLRSFEDRNGHRLDIVREPTLGRVGSIVDQISGRAITFNYAAPSATGPATITMTQVKADAQQNLVTPTWAYEYDLFNAKRFLRKVCNARNPNLATGHCQLYNYDNADPTPARTELLHEVKRPEGNADVRVAYDTLALGGPRVVKRTDGVGNVTVFVYGWDAATSSINQVTINEAAGWTTVEKYEPGQGRILERTVSPGGVATTTKWHYNTAGFVDEIKQGSGTTWETTTIVTDERGNPLDVTDTRGKTTRFRYPPSSLIDKRTDQPLWRYQPGIADGSPESTPGVTKYTYDSNGNLTEEAHTVAAGVTLKSITAYTVGTEAAIGGGVMPSYLIRSTTTPGGQTTINAYDSKGNIRETTEPAGARSAYDADELGRTTGRSDISTAFPSGVKTEFTLDVVGNVIYERGPAVTNSINGLVHRRQAFNVYDTNNRLRRTELSDIGGSAKPDAMRAKDFDYTANDQQWRVTDSYGKTLTRSFDANNNVRTVTDENGNTVQTDFTAGNFAQKVTVLGYKNRPGSTARNIVSTEITEFDVFGRPRKVRDAKIRTRTKEYWPGGLLKTVILDSYSFNNGTVSPVDDTTGPLVLESYTYDDDGNVKTAFTSDSRRQTTFDYDRGGRTTAITQLVSAGVNKTTTNQYNSPSAPMLPSQQTTAMTGDPATSVISTTFDTFGRPTAVQSANGATPITQRFGYDDRGNQTASVPPQVTDADPVADAKKAVVFFDEYNRPWKRADPATAVVSFVSQSPANVAPTTFTGYNTFSEVSETKDANGAVVVSEFDLLGRLSKRSQPTYTPVAGTPATAAVNASETFIYDGVGNLTSVLNRRGQTTSFQFDTVNRPAATIYPAVGGTTVESSVVFDDVGQVSQMTDRAGAITTRTFDELDRLKSQTVNVRAPVGAYATKFLYYPSGELLAQEDPFAKTQLYQVDFLGHRTSTTDEIGKLTTFTYDRLDNLKVSTDPLNRQTESVFDQAGRRTEDRLRGSGGVIAETTKYTLDEAGNVKTTTFARGGVVNRTFDLNNRLQSVANPNDSTPNTFSFGYDAAGNSTQTVDGRGSTTWKTYNPWNLVDKAIEPATTATPNEPERTYASVYDAGGLPVYSLEPGAVLVSRTFDERGRLTNETGAGAVAAVSATRAYTYDEVDRTKTASHPSGSVVFGYDDRGLLTSATNPSGNSSFVYDALGRMTTRTDPAGTATMTWTPRSELWTITAPIAGPLTYGWNDAGQISSIVQGATTRSYAYDPAGRLITDTLVKTTGATLLAKQEYTYDPDGNVATQKISLGTNTGNGTHNYGYTLSGQLGSWQKDTGPTTAYAYDANGNRTTAGAVTFTFDQRNRLTNSSDGTATTWTPRGTLQKTVKGATTTNFAFDGLGRQTNAGAVTYTYDGLNRIVTRNATTTLRYAGTETDPVDVGTHTIIRTPYGDAYAVKVTSGAATFGLGTNRHGDITHTYNTTTGAYSGSRTFDPYGTPINATGTVTPLGYQGDYTDPTTGDINAAARWYRPATAQFLSRDTYPGETQTPISLNRYTYANNNPTRYWDPTGNLPGDRAIELANRNNPTSRPTTNNPTRPSNNTPAPNQPQPTIGTTTNNQTNNTATTTNTNSGIPTSPANGRVSAAINRQFTGNSAPTATNRETQSILCNPKKGALGYLTCPNIDNNNDTRTQLKTFNIVDQKSQTQNTAALTPTIDGVTIRTGPTVTTNNNNNSTTVLTGGLEVQRPFLRPDTGDILKALAAAATGALATAIKHYAEQSDETPATEPGVAGSLDPSKTGPGAVPKDQRDKKRTQPRGEKEAQLDAQGGRCANCGNPVTVDDVDGHHYPDRHADGGRDFVEVCKLCHKGLHSGKKKP